MIFRIFIGVLILFAAVLLHDIYQLNRTYGKLANISDNYAMTSQNADLSVVEFLSYGCPYCRDAHPVIKEAVQKDGAVKYMPVPMAAEDENALKAAQLAYAAGMQGKFIEMHNAIIEDYRPIDDQLIQDLALVLGLNPERLKTDMGSKEIEEQLKENYAIFGTLGGYGTPSFLIGSSTFFVPSEGPASVQDFLNMFNAARQGS